MLNAGDDGSGVSDRSDDQTLAPMRKLPIGNIEFRFCFLYECLIAGVGGDANDLGLVQLWLCVQPKCKAKLFSNRIRIAEVPLGHGLVDYRSELSVRVIIQASKVAASQKLHAERVEIVGRHGSNRNDNLVFEFT